MLAEDSNAEKLTVWWGIKALPYYLFVYSNMQEDHKKNITVSFRMSEAHINSLKYYAARERNLGRDITYIDLIREDAERLHPIVDPDLIWQHILHCSGFKYNG